MATVVVSGRVFKRTASLRLTSVSLERVYELFEDTFSDARRLQILPYTSSAESLCHRWRQQGIPISAHDLTQFTQAASGDSISPSCLPRYSITSACIFSITAR